MKVLVIGLDGASFELIDPWITEGVLPNLKKIKEKGIWGDMVVCLPPVTAPNWKCYSTGKNPGKLGIFWWENIDFDRKTVYFQRSRIYDNKEIWDYLSESGKKVGVIGMPMTYPPKKVNGFMVSGGVDAEEDGFVYPKDLETKIKKMGYKIHPDLIYFINDSDEKKANEAINQLIKIIDNTFDVAFDLLDINKVPLR